MDDNTGGWGHIDLDQVVLSDTQAKPPSTETGVNLLVDGKVVQSVTGADSENLDWASFNTTAYKGKKVHSRSSTPTPAAGDTSSPTSSPPPTSPP
ncbi:hypothetical protein QA942_14710 [Streptomyces sp. B21-106]|uniref:hypothetical protein n=1 Tax=Streptomyces sp. B21-106 TaxID=3039418 RepID=UPI002FF231EC